jgi:hypothetical protein
VNQCHTSLSNPENLDEMFFTPAAAQTELELANLDWMCYCNGMSRRRSNEQERKSHTCSETAEVATWIVKTPPSDSE